MENKYPAANMYPEVVPAYILDIQTRLGRVETKLDTLLDRSKEARLVEALDGIRAVAYDRDGHSSAENLGKLVDELYALALKALIAYHDPTS